MSPDAAVDNDVINALQQEMGRGSAKLFDVVPTLLRTVIDEKAWLGRTDKAGRPFETFESFVTHPLWWGLESTVGDLLAYCRNAADVQQMINAELAAAPKHVGRGHRTDIVNPNSGNAATYALRRLKRDWPDLADQVVKGALTANAAAIAAGFRKKMISVPATDLDAAMRILARHYDPTNMAIAAARLRKP